MNGELRVNKWLIATTVMIPTIMEIVDTSVANVALNQIRGSLSAGVDEATWIITSYLVSNAIIIPLTGWLSRRFGRKRYLSFSIALFTISSFLSGSASNLTMLIIFRVLQGVGGGALQPMSQAILLESFPPREHGMAMALFGVGIMFGPIIGPFLGGWLTDTLSWRWIFYVNIPIGVVALIMVTFFVFDPSYLRRAKEKIDYWGLALLVIGIGCLQIVLDKGQREEWFSSAFIVILSTISAVALVFFIYVELTTEKPVVNLRTFRNIEFAAGNIIMFIAFFSFFGSLVLLPLYLQLLMGYTATLAGLALTPGGVASLISMIIMGRLISRIDPRLIIFCGLLIAATSFYMMTRFNLFASYSYVVMPRIVQGFGVGLLFVPLTTLTLTEIPREEMGNATSIFNLLRNLGGSFGVAFSATFLNRNTQIFHNNLVSHLLPTSTNYQHGISFLQSVLVRLGINPAIQEQAALGALNNELQRQSLMLAFNATFGNLFLIFLLAFLFLFLLKRPRYGQDPIAAH